MEWNSIGYQVFLQSLKNTSLVSIVWLGAITAGVCQHGDIQLVSLPGSVDEAGKVEICVDGVWSNICGRGWSSHDAGIVCRQLGYSFHGMHF